MLIEDEEEEEEKLKQKKLNRNVIREYRMSKSRERAKRAAAIRTENSDII
jgi:hypothetical protein